MVVALAHHYNAHQALRILLAYVISHVWLDIKELVLYVIKNVPMGILIVALIVLIKLV